MKLGLYN